MGKKYTEDTEFGGVPGQPFPKEKGYEPKNYELTREMYQSDPMDAEGASDVVTQRAQ